MAYDGIVNVALLCKKISPRGEHKDFVSGLTWNSINKNSKIYSKLGR